MLTLKVQAAHNGMSCREEKMYQKLMAARIKGAKSRLPKAAKGGHAPALNPASQDSHWRCQPNLLHHLQCSMSFFAGAAMQSPVHKELIESNEPSNHKCEAR